MTKTLDLEKDLDIKKKKFKMPHLLWIMLGLLTLASLATYVIPAGNFAVDENGAILGDQFELLGHQTPVHPWMMLMLFLDGLTQSSTIIYLVLVAGATISVLLASGAVDNILNWAIYKLKDKGLGILVSAMFILIVYIGGFAGSDALIALVPIGVIFARKLKLDPIVAIGITTFPALIGFGTGPQGLFIPQMMIGIAPYSGFGLRFVMMNFFMVIGLIYLMRYIKKIQKNEQSSLMFSEGWRAQAFGQQSGDHEIKEEKLKFTSVLALLSFIVQYLVIISYSAFGGNSEMLYNFIIVINILTAIVIGLLTRMTLDNLGDSFAKGLASMAFIAFIIGLARVMSLILTEGNILDTIVYTLTQPLMGINQSFSTIGIALIISILNPLIPSATSKAAILIPIIEPIADTLGLPKQVAIQAFQFGDGFTNLLSPVLGWTIGSCVAAGVAFTKWVRWVFPAVVLFMLLSGVILYVLTSIGWTGGAS
ncbi:AbgT family transporter [Sporosarcina sp. HYO08]|uniref:AbgT family transporter n=1 Tax=Sporosarcina sp. HYO08 TaxID=1759557 RepID=UPI000795BB56|nr:AbgT family transporter [Sporosarcina sp. HYO08]KXH86092.1 hypothetical protein AU377_14720 [Sporosarcina sp. HYO08]